MLQKKVLNRVRPRQIQGKKWTEKNPGNLQSKNQNIQEKKKKCRKAILRAYKEETGKQ